METIIALNESVVKMEVTGRMPLKRAPYVTASEYLLTKYAFVVFESLLGKGV